MTGRRGGLGVCGLLLCWLEQIVQEGVLIPDGGDADWALPRVEEGLVGFACPSGKLLMAEAHHLVASVQGYVFCGCGDSLRLLFIVEVGVDCGDDGDPRRW